MRWIALGSILLVLLLTLGPTVHSLVRQRGEIARLQTSVAEQEVDNAALRAEQERWKDPAYVEQQARDRLKFVKVGDRSYTVIDPEEAARPAVTGASVAAPKANGSAPWYGQLWQSIQLADRPTAGMAP
ncbi:MAG: septum formation initiator family protein [Actinomycetales bacterium]|nr:septum formation initiator family protein [Actinomycetales bacterium]